jgi:hypothetical protein
MSPRVVEGQLRRRAAELLDVAFGGVADLRQP